ncbi:hypothetical protein DSL92_08235 [Billgrantia gudaonensis]|uniref:Uncharacterized protein n=1 Tax=Billgrantia gudaonensis TaxID=376427 RepID=A0A3S0QFL3_9GAMM|nr:hypothetical protein DSL92_08235 [Halomonas gudaonensis]
MVLLLMLEVSPPPPLARRGCNWPLWHQWSGLLMWTRPRRSGCPSTGRWRRSRSGIAAAVVSLVERQRVSSAVPALLEEGMLLGAVAKAGA